MRTTVRYFVQPVLWTTLKDRGVTTKALAEQTPNTQQWASWVEKHPLQCVSPAWAESVARFLDLPLAALFVPVEVPLNIPDRLSVRRKNANALKRRPAAA